MLLLPAIPHPTHSPSRRHRGVKTQQNGLLGCPEVWSSRPSWPSSPHRSISRCGIPACSMARFPRSHRSEDGKGLSANTGGGNETALKADAAVSQQPRSGVTGSPANSLTLLAPQCYHPSHGEGYGETAPKRSVQGGLENVCCAVEMNTEDGWFKRLELQFTNVFTILSGRHYSKNAEDKQDTALCPQRVSHGTE